MTKKHLNVKDKKEIQLVSSIPHYYGMYVQCHRSYESESHVTYPVVIINMRTNLARRPLLLARLRCHRRVWRHKPVSRTDELLVMVGDMKRGSPNIGALSGVVLASTTM